jgi:hypothetical protein
MSGAGAQLAWARAVARFLSGAGAQRIPWRRGRGGEFLGAAGAAAVSS